MRLLYCCRMVVASLLLSVGYVVLCAGGQLPALPLMGSLELGAVAQGVVFAPDGSFFLVTVKAEGHSHVARVSVGSWAVSELPLDVSECYPLCLSPDGRLLIYGYRGLVHVVEMGSYRDVMLLPGKPRAYAFSPDGKLLAAVNQTDTLTIWDVGTWRERRSSQIACAYASVRGLAFASGGNALVTFGKTRIATWTFASHDAASSLGYSGSTTMAQVMPDGRRLVLCDGDGTMRVIDLEDGRQTASVPVSATPSSLQFAPDARWALCVDGSDMSVSIHSVLSGARVATLEGGAPGTQSAAFCPSGRYVVSVAGTGRVFIWDVSALELAVGGSFEITTVDWREGSVTITNVSAHRLDLLGWTITDGRMSSTFRSSLVVDAGESCIVYPDVISPSRPQGGRGPGGTNAGVSLLAPKAFGGSPESTKTR